VSCDEPEVIDSDITLHASHGTWVHCPSERQYSTDSRPHNTRPRKLNPARTHTHKHTSLQWRRQGSKVGGGAKLVSRVPSSSFPPIPLPSFLSLFPSPSFLTFLPLLSFSPSFLPKIQLGVWGSAASSPSGARGGAPAAKAFLPYFETRRRSSCNDFGSFCTDQNIHLTQDRSYWLLPPYTSYDYFSSDLCWS